MRNYKEMLKTYLDGKEQKDKAIVETIEVKIGKENAKIIRDSIPKLLATTSEPSYSRAYTLVNRWKTLSDLLEKPFDKLTEADLIKLNNGMRNKGMTSAKYYRKSLKQLLRLMDRKKYIDLIESPYLKESGKKNSSKMLVNPEHFWTLKNMVDYIIESKRFSLNELVSLRQTAFGGVFLSFGLRPQEQLDLIKKRITYKTGELKIKVHEGKTGSRIVIIEGNEAVAIWELIEPYLNKLQDDDLLFPFSYEYGAKVHKRICAKIGIPKGKPRQLYIGRKMTLSHFYNTFKVTKASAMAGHVQGSNSMQSYVALTELMLTEGVPRLQKRYCPNCNEFNDVEKLHCFKCQSPLSQNDFEELVKDSGEIKSIEMKDLTERLMRTEENLSKCMEFILATKTA